MSLSVFIKNEEAENERQVRFFPSSTHFSISPNIQSRDSRQESSLSHFQFYAADMSFDRFTVLRLHYPIHLIRPFLFFN